MTSLNANMRLKVKKDTFYNADPNGNVYFRNNSSSFRMEGEGIDRWIEKLLPIFNGEHTLAEMTEGLPGPYRNQIIEIAETLYRNGYVRDVSQDMPHRLPEPILRAYAAQIEFLDHFGNSGAYRFQAYRQSNVLAVGSGTFFVALVSALLESGLPKIGMLITDGDPTDRARLAELESHARKTDAEAKLEEIYLPKQRNHHWLETVKPFDCILYASREGELETMRQLHQACKEEKKLFIPAVCFRQIGLAGPLIHPDFEGCWESAWRRIHQSAFRNGAEADVSSSTAEAMLANVIVFESFKKITGVTNSDSKNQLFLFDLETLEGRWHLFKPHPLVNGLPSIVAVQDLKKRLEYGSSRSAAESLPFFGGLTSERTGVFHRWEEGDLHQLPLAQCRVQVVNPLSDGPAELLPETICTGLTHEEARRNAGLAGIEAYVSRLSDPLVRKFLADQHSQETEMDRPSFVGVGAGASVAEGVCRGLHRCLSEKLVERQFDKLPAVIPVLLSDIEDTRCQYYVNALSTMVDRPKTGLGEPVAGFPVVWIGIGDRWFGSVGLNETHALRNALQQALQNEIRQTTSYEALGLEVPFVNLTARAPIPLHIPAYDESSQSSETILSAMQTLERSRVHLMVLDLTLEPFLKEELAGVFGVALREGAKR